MNILIDPGHGGNDSGAVGIAGSYEKDIVLNVGKLMFTYIKELSGGKANPILSRTTDKFLTLSQRRNLADSKRAILISLHCNAGGGTGYEAFTYPGYSKSDPLATAMLKGWADDGIAINTLRADYGDGDPDKEARFTVLGTDKEAVLFEMGFMDRASDERIMNTPEFQDKAAKSLATSVLKHYGLLSYEKVTAETPALVVEDSVSADDVVELRKTAESLVWQADKLLAKLKSIDNDS